MRILREIFVSEITETIKRLLLEANIFQNKEDIENISGMGDDAEAQECQDTGMVEVFLGIGQDVHIKGGNLEKAINMGVTAACAEVCRKKSIIPDPLNRIGSGSYAPAIIHTKIIDGEKLKISVMAEGFGNENMSAVKMLKPTDGRKGAVDFVIETVKKMRANDCHPLVIGIGIGGTMEMAALMSKHALLRNLKDENKNDFYSDLEKEILSRINDTGKGPKGMGEPHSVLAVKAEFYPTHISGLPIAVNITCHEAQHKEAEI